MLQNYITLLFVLVTQNFEFDLISRLFFLESNNIDKKKCVMSSYLESEPTGERPEH